MIEDPSALAKYRGVVRLFPLPNLVLFPHVMQPLHVFEPRYRQLAVDALAGDRLITMALLKPGWEPKYAGSPEIHPMACIGRVAAEQRLADGRFNLLLEGLSRVQITKEIPQCKQYRKARADLAVDVDVDCPLQTKKLRRQLRRLAARWFAGQDELLKQLRKLFRSDMSLGGLADVLAFALPLSLEVKQDLLDELDVEKRVAQLLCHLESEPSPTQGSDAKDGRTFPPDFSCN